MSIVNQNPTFNRNAAKLTAENLHFFACLCELAYKENLDEKDEYYLTRVKATLDSWHFVYSDIRPLDDRSADLSRGRTDTEGLIISNSTDTVIAMRGSEPQLIDWLNNFNFFKEKWRLAENHKVHNGFFDCFEAVQERIDRALKDHPNTKVWLAGHSLGGAIVTIIAYYLKLKYPGRAIGAIYTFGQPRVLSFKFAKDYNEQLEPVFYRVVNNSDLVTRVPPQVFNFSHIGQLAYFDKDGDFSFDDNVRSWWGRFWDRAAGRLDDFFDSDITPDSLEDHTLFHDTRIKCYVKLAEHYKNTSLN